MTAPIKCIDCGAACVATLRTCARCFFKRGKQDAAVERVEAVCFEDCCDCEAERSGV